MEKPFITIGWHKGECDFRVSSEIQELGPGKMKDLREMIVVAIGTAEDMWRRQREVNNMLVSGGMAVDDRSAGGQA